MTVTRPQPEQALIEFLDALTGQRKDDALALCALMHEISGESAVLWGKSIVGFGACHYKYESGHEGDVPLIAFSPRAKAFSLYISNSYPEYQKLLSRLGKYKLSGSCLHVAKLDDVERAVLKELITASFAHSKSLGPE